MKLHLKQIPPEGRHFAGEEPAASLELAGTDFTARTPITYAIEVGLSEGGLFATGTLAVELECACVSCLERFTLPVRVADFACQVELSGAEEIDLTEPMREDILLALPAHPRCDWAGTRTCPGVARPAVEPSAEAATPSRETWAALDQLKLQ
jgi:uncharacterized metal-binding protein YceD (DUF177 family)